MARRTRKERITCAAARVGNRTDGVRSSLSYACHNPTTTRNHDWEVPAWLRTRCVARRKGAPQPRLNSPTLQPLMQSLLATLANIDFEYEHEIRRVGRSSTEAGVKNYLMERFKER